MVGLLLVLVKSIPGTVVVVIALSRGHVETGTGLGAGAGCGVLVVLLVVGRVVGGREDGLELLLEGIALLLGLEQLLLQVGVGVESVGELLLCLAEFVLEFCNFLH